MNEVNAETTAPVCTCNDEFYSTVCPVHSKAGLASNSVVEINDGHLINAKPIVIQGHLFECPYCKQATIFVNKNYIPPTCCECKSDIVVKSKVFSDHVRNEAASLNATEIAVGGML